MKRALMAMVLAALLATPALCDEPTEELRKQTELLQKQIEELQAKIKALEEKQNAAAAAAAAAPAPAPAPAAAPEAASADAKQLEERLTAVESKVAGDTVSWSGDLFTRFDSAKWHFEPYQQFRGFVQNPEMPGMPMPIVQPVGAQDWQNSVQWSTRLRLNLGVRINENARIMGRLAMYKVHGGADVPTFNGSPNTVANSFNSGKVPGTDVLRVERASLVYRTPAGILSIGRQNTSDGPPFEVREGGERMATPQALAVNATIDGIGWKFELDKLGLPEGTLFGLCYGVGYESGFGGGGLVQTNAAPVGFNFTNATMANPAGATLQVNSIGPLEDSTVMGAMFDMPLLWETGETVHSTNLYVGYNRFGDMTDIPYGSLINFPVPAAPGMGGSPSTQYVTATSNLGDMDQYTLTWKHKFNDAFTYFVSAGYIKSRPNGKTSQYGAYWTFPDEFGGTVQLTGFGGLLGDPNNSKTGSAVYAGIRWEALANLGLGLEFNHGSPNWFTYNPAMGEYTEKLGARGDVWEGYAHWRFAKNAALRFGYIYYDYSTAFSGWHIAPMPLENFDLSRNPMLQYAFPKTVKDAYAALEVKF